VVGRLGDGETGLEDGVERLQRRSTAKLARAIDQPRAQRPDMSDLQQAFCRP